MKGARKDKNVLDALRVLFMHLGLGYSLKETAVRAELAGLCKMSSVALFGRLKKFGPFFQALCEKMFKENQSFIDAANFRIIDATSIKEPGDTGSSWRFHYSFSIPAMVCDFTKLTSTKGKGTGETLTHFPVKENDLIIADRGYCNVRGIAHVKKHGGDVCVRLRHGALPFYSDNDEKINLIPFLKKLTKPGDSAQWSCYIKSPETGELIKGRICAIRKTPEHILKSHKRCKQKESSKRRAGLNYTTSKDAFYTNEFIIIFTTFDAQEYPLQKILEIYRWRWQIELVFKRFKSLLELGHLPKTTQKSARAWLYGKLLIALLIEKINAVNSAFSLWSEKVSVGSDEK